MAAASCTRLFAAGGGNGRKKFIVEPLLSGTCFASVLFFLLLPFAAATITEAESHTCLVEVFTGPEPGQGVPVPQLSVMSTGGSREQKCQKYKGR